MLQQVMVEEDVPHILSIRPGGLDSRKGYSWMHNEKGIYSVKSGYKLWESLSSQSLNQVPEQAPNYSAIYQSIWKSKTSPKLKHFLWRSISSSLAVATEMKKRRLANDDTCTICGQGKEDVLHLLFTCAFSRTMWVQSPYAPILSDTSCSIQGKLSTCFILGETMEDEFCHLWTWIVWRIWKIRNEAVYQGIQPDALKGYNFALSDAKEWQAHQTILNAPVQAASSHESSNLQWVPPPLDVLKCNTDATWQDDHDRCGVSWILRNSHGHVIFWGIKTFPKLLSPLEAEAAALVWASFCIGNMGYGNVMYECDSSLLFEAVTDPASNPRLITYTSEIIGKLRRNNRLCRFTKVARQGNMAADTLAKYAKDFPLYYGFIDNRIPLWLNPFLDVNA